MYEETEKTKILNIVERSWTSLDCVKVTPCKGLIENVL